MRKLTLTLFLLFSGTSALAATSGSDRSIGLEIRGTYGVWAAPADMNSYYTNLISDWPAQPQPKVMGGDILYQPNGSPLVFGGRYETFTSNSASEAGPTSYGGVSFTDYGTKLTASRASVLIGARHDFSSGFVGVLLSVGVVQNSTLTVKADGTSSSDKGKVPTSYSAGLEGGLRIGILELGAEAGYLSMKVTEFDDPTNNNQAVTSNGSNLTANFSGVYGKVFAGFAF